MSPWLLPKLAAFGFLKTIDGNLKLINVNGIVVVLLEFPWMRRFPTLANFASSKLPNSLNRKEERAQFGMKRKRLSLEIRLKYFRDHRDALCGGEETSKRQEFTTKFLHLEM